MAGRGEDVDFEVFEVDFNKAFYTLFHSFLLQDGHLANGSA